MAKALYKEFAITGASIRIIVHGFGTIRPSLNCGEDVTSPAVGHVAVRRRNAEVSFATWLVGRVAWLWHLYLAAQLLLAIWYSIRKNDADVLIQIVAISRRTTDVKMNQISQDRSILGVSRSTQGSLGTIGAIVGTRINRHINYRTGRIAPLTNEGLLSRFHVGEIIRDEEQLDSGLVWILEYNLQLALLGNAIATPRRFLWGRSSFRSLMFTFSSLHVSPLILVVCLWVWLITTVTSMLETLSARIRRSRVC